MAFVAGARNIQDALVNPATFTLPAAASTNTTSAAVDLGADAIKPEGVEVEIAIPALSSTIAPAGSTEGVTLSIETSTSSTFSTIARTILSKNYAGSSTGVSASAARCRLPADCE